MINTSVLVTGSKSGIGRGLLSAYALRPNTTAIAAIRDGPNSSAAAALESLPVGTNSKIIVVKYDAASTTAAIELASDLGLNHSITSLDIVIANAGILKHAGPVVSCPPELIAEHFQINTLGPIILYQGLHSLLRAAPSPKFLIISSTLGSIGFMENMPMPMLAYGISKSAVNYFAKKAHLEDDKITVLTMQPGWVQTDMGGKAAEYVGMTKADVPVTIQQSVSGLMGVFDRATKHTTSGQFRTFSDDIMSW